MVVHLRESSEDFNRKLQYHRYDLFHFRALNNAERRGFFVAHAEILSLKSAQELRSAVLDVSESKVAQNECVCDWSSWFVAIHVTVLRLSLGRP
jgi:hypothetical protein